MPINNASTGSISKDIKYLFLTFAQSFFAVNQDYPWMQNPALTEIVIADKYAVDIGVAVKKPLIVLSRGAYRWAMLVRDQDGQNTGNIYEEGIEQLKGPLGSANAKVNRSYTDLLTGTVTYNVVSKNGVEAEELADTLFTALTTNKPQLKAAGIHLINALQIGDEQILRLHGTSEIEATLIPITVAFTMQKTLKAGEKQFKVLVTINDIEAKEGIHYRVGPNGQTIIFEKAPLVTDVLKLSYTEAISLAERDDKDFVESPDGTLLTFTVPDNEAIYGYYILFAKAIITEDEFDREIIVD